MTLYDLWGHTLFNEKFASIMFTFLKSFKSKEVTEKDTFDILR